MSTDDQFPVNDLDALRALILGEDDAAVRSVSKLARRIDTVEEMLRDDPASVERLQAVSCVGWRATSGDWCRNG